MAKQRKATPMIKDERTALRSDSSAKRPTSSEKNLSPKRLTTPEELAKQDIINKALSRSSKTRKGIITTRSEASISYGGDNTPLRSATLDAIPTRTPEQSLTRTKSRELGEMLKAEEYWKSISKTEEEFQSHLKKHAFNLPKKIQLMSEIPEEELNRVFNEYTIPVATTEKYGVKPMATKKIIKNVPKNINAVPNTKVPYGGNIPTKEQWVDEIIAHLQSQKGKKVDRTEEQARDIQSEWNIRKWQRKYDIHPKKTFKGNIPKTGRYYGGQMPEVSSTTKNIPIGKNVPKNINAVPKTKVPYGGQPSGTYKQYGNNPAGWGKVPLSSWGQTSLSSSMQSTGSKIKNVIPRIAKSQTVRSATKIGSRVASSGVMRATGMAGAAISLAGDIMNISRATREVRKAIIRQPVRATERAKVYGDYLKANKTVPLTKQTVTTPIYTNKPMNLSYPKQGVDTKPKQIKQSILSKPNVPPIRKKASSWSDSSAKRPTRTKPAVSTPLLSAIIPKRPDQIKESLAFLNPLQSVPSIRISPVRPTPTRIQLPEQFMSPSMSLATLPKINRYKLGITR